MITENGIADKNDRYRGPFIIAHIEQIRAAINEGVNIIGYLHWSLLDNYEWHEGYREEGKFGLLSIDHKNSNFKRSVTKGAEIYSLIINQSVLSNEKISGSAIEETKKNFGTFIDYGTNTKYIK